MCVCVRACVCVCMCVRVCGMHAHDGVMYITIASLLAQ